MPETFTKAERSRIMAAVRSHNTMPEIRVRQLVHRLGFRFRLHAFDLPGKPDIVLRRHKKIINVNGCFWHLHSCPHGRRAPVANAEYWQAKRDQNARRDRRNLRALRREGWAVLTIWECQMRDPLRLTRRIARFLSA